MDGRWVDRLGISGCTREEWLNGSLRDGPQRDPDTGFRRPRRCDWYAPGHTPHYIQARLSWEDKRARPVPGVVVRVGWNFVGVETDRGVAAYRNHETPRLAELLDHYGSDVLVHVRYSLLLVPTGGSHYCFSIAAAREPWTACASDDPWTDLDDDDEDDAHDDGTERSSLTLPTT